MTTKIMDHILKTPTLIEQKLQDKHWTAKLDRAWNSRYHSMTIIASGTSYRAACCVGWYLRQTLQIPVFIHTSFAFEHYTRIDRTSFHLVINQSGHNASTNRAILKLKEAKLSWHLITNNFNIQDTPLQTVTYLDIEEENSDFTMTGFSMISLILMVFACNAVISKEPWKTPVRQLNWIPDWVRSQIEDQKQCLKKHPGLHQAQRIHFCTSGSTTSTAYEVAEKMRQILQIAASAHEVENFIHGGYREVKPDHYIFLIIQDDATRPMMEQLQKNLACLTENTIVLEDQSRHDASIAAPFFATFFQALVCQIHMERNLGEPLLQKSYKEFEEKMQIRSDIIDHDKPLNKMS